MFENASKSHIIAKHVNLKLRDFIIFWIFWINMFCHIVAFRSIFEQHFTNRPFFLPLSYILFFSDYLFTCPTAEIQGREVKRNTNLPKPFPQSAINQKEKKCMSTIHVRILWNWLYSSHGSNLPYLQLFSSGTVCENKKARLVLFEIV